MVGVPVLFIVWVCAFVPVVWVMVVVVGVFGWRVFQWCVAVVLPSRRVPGVSGCSGGGGLVWVCPGVVGWLVFAWVGAEVGVGWFVVGLLFWLVCVSWFRMLMRFVSLSVFLFLVCSCLLFG